MTTELQDPRIVEYDVRTDEMLVNMGPQHPSTHGVLRLLLRTDGEIVHEVTPHLGYLHRCAEKIGENLAPPQWVPYTDRMDYLAGMNMNLGMSLAVEKLVGMELPEKAQVIRVLIAELGRIASHLVGMGAYGLDLGTFSPFLWAFREREIVLDLFEEVCGARLTYSYITPGGATHDLPGSINLPPGLASLTNQSPETTVSWTDALTQFLNWLEPRIEEYHTLLTRNQIFIKRTAGLGVMSPEMAKSYGCTGPVLRGSGVDWDLRRDGEDYFLVTPVEKVGITVDDAPFVAVDFEATGTGRDQVLNFTTQVDDQVSAGPDHPIRVVRDPETGEPSPYVHVRANLEALIDRKSFYRLVDIGVTHRVDGDDWFGLWSGGQFFPIIPAAELP